MQQTISSPTEQVTSPTSLDDLRALQESPTATTPPVVPIAIPTVTDTQRRQSQRQDSIPPPRRRESQPPATPKDAEATSALDPIAESAAKDKKRFIKRLIKTMEEFNKPVQGPERDFNFAHTAQGGTIRIPDSSHDQAIHEAFRELIESGESEPLRRFQETSVKMNQILTVSGVVTGRHKLTKCSGNTK